MIFKINALGGYFNRGPIGLRSIFGEKSLKSIKRYITEVLSSAQSFGQFTEPVSLSSDFEIEFTHLIKTTNSRAALGQAANNDNIIYTDSGSLKLRVNSGSFYSFGTSPATLNDEKLHTTIVKRVGTSITATTDGLAHSASITNSDTLTLDVIMRFASVYSDGILTDLKITDNGTLIVDCPLNEGPSIPYFANRAATLGSELWSFGEITVDGSTAQYATIAGSYNQILPIDSSFEVNVSWTNLTGRLILLVGDDSTSTDNVTNNTGSLSYIASSSGSQRLVLQEASSLGSTADVVTVSVKEIPAATPYITKENIADTQTVLYDQVSDGWTGPNLWTFGEALDVNITTSGTTIIGVSSGASITQGTTYRTEGISNLNNTVQLLLADQADLNIQSGKFSTDLTSGSTSTQLRFRTGGDIPVTGDLSNITTKRFIEVA